MGLCRGKSISKHTDWLIESWGKRRDALVVVIGDSGTGKSSLISAVAGHTFSWQVDPILPPLHLYASFRRDEDGTGFHHKEYGFERYVDEIFQQGSVTILDTSSHLKNEGKLKNANVVVLTYACGDPESFNRLLTYWFPRLKEFEVKVPVILAACKGDTKSDRDPKEDMPFLAKFLDNNPIENCIICSARSGHLVHEVFYCAQKAVFYPTLPLYDMVNDRLRMESAVEFHRIFHLCDQDRDDVLNKKEWEEFQVNCFNTLQTHSEDQMKYVRKIAGVGITAIDFRNILKLYITDGAPEKVWTVLMTYRNAHEQQAVQRAPDQSVELKSKAIQFLEQKFKSLKENDATSEVPVMSEKVVLDIFSASESSMPDSFANAVPRTNAFYNLDGFLSMWRAMTLLDPDETFQLLMLSDYEDHPDSAFHVTRKRTLNRKIQQSDRKVFQCFVFGPEAEKSEFMNQFIGRSNCSQHSNSLALDNCQVDQNFAVNIVGIDESRETLVLQKMPVNIECLLCKKDSLAACDVAIFLYDSSNQDSFGGTAEALLLVARHSKTSGFEVPCLLVAVERCPPVKEVAQSSQWASQYMGIEAAIIANESNLNAVFDKIVIAAKRPHENIPNSKALEYLHDNMATTVAGRNRNEYSRIFVLVGAAVAVGLAGLFATRKFDLL